VVPGWIVAGATQGAVGFQGWHGAEAVLLWRLSEDLHFTLIAEAPFDVIRQELDPVFVEVRHLSGVTISFAWTTTRHLRHPIFLGMRGDKQAREGRREGFSGARSGL
jgi:hypothetical protein